MPKLNCHVALYHGLDLVQLKPGDELPKWAVGIVGDHCLDGEAVASEEVAEATETEEVEESEEAAEAEEAEESEEVAEAAPDFTKPATRRGRPRAKKA